ncbi:Peptide-methionine (S)-S-oxide reductase [Agyrium rufum]|nr:Peptide-methionine (S)-S-oxide reductase [Agyrium rufum]
MPSFITRMIRPFQTSTKMGLTPESATQSTNVETVEGTEKCIVAAGCFWGVEHAYRKAFTGRGLIDARVGYCGGASKNPSYQAVCSGRTGHAEALLVTFDPEKVTYNQLVEFFYKMHDPTTKNRQGMDSGSQYRSAIFTTSPQQEILAKEITAKVQEQWWKKGTISTEIAPMAEWYDAEDYHQKYLAKTPHGYECPSHFVRKFPDLV